MGVSVQSLAGGINLRNSTKATAAYACVGGAYPGAFPGTVLSGHVEGLASLRNGFEAGAASPVVAPSASSLSSLNGEAGTEAGAVDPGGPGRDMAASGCLADHAGCHGVVGGLVDQYEGAGGNGLLEGVGHDRFLQRQLDPADGVHG